MSYAQVAATNPPPTSSADPAFLEGSYNQAPTDGHGAADVPSQQLPDVNSHKVNVVPSGTDLNHLHTQTEHDAQQAEQQARDAAKQAEQRARETAQHAEKRAREEASKLQDKAHAAKEDAKDGLRKAEKKVSKAADDASRQAKKSWAEFSSDPKKWASSLGAVNLAILGGLGIAAYAQRDTIKTWDRRTIGTIVAGIAAVIGVQAYFGAEKAQEQSGKK
ncbi:hypothetical protein OC834_006086 [Tilletia horrida]|uniref:Mitochondrial outer membrane protein OM14 C-terminal domain-containing protein n=1 Tax=Tilletia horrida TaxID=155126 RepID=A0AAN6G8X8_9BASI|nr:hypothetical protein OC834_006086 [Tilletia horrida]KAK0524212.1 hypothetical protein OC835_006000 [Tilletia horrida]KAK0525238.1 hypothetical protein OC842_005569 [Tilletia horrida]KAK0559981.1 hypothetical protein OC844_004051 [Tilletia horrida]